MANWERVGLGVLTVCAIAFAWKAADDGALVRKAADREHLLEAQLKDKSRVELASMTQECAARAEARFHKEGYSSDDTDYRSHYNQSNGKCFMEINVIKPANGDQFIAHDLIDVDENRTFAHYDGMFVASGNFSCRLFPIRAPERKCASEDEYKAFVSQYME